MMDDFPKRPPVGFTDGAERSVGRVSDADEEGHDIAFGYAQDGPGGGLVPDGGVAGADAEVGGREQDGVGRLAEVVLVDDARAVVSWFRHDQGDRGRGAPA